MNRKKDIQELVDATMQSLDGMQRAAANPHLYTRIRAALEDERSVWSSIAGFISRPAIAGSLVLLVIVLNILTITRQPGPRVEESNDQLVTLAQDYSFQSSNLLENGYNQP